MRFITSAQLDAMAFPPIAPNPPTVPTWADLERMEPRLLDVELRAARFHREGQTGWESWSAIKAMFSRLVGWEAEKYTLRHSAAYDVAYDHLLHVWETGRRPKSRGTR